MKVLVISDTHGLVEPVQKLIDQLSIECVIHLGDHNTDLNKLDIHPSIKQLSVAGNCDATGKEELVISLANYKIMLCHGHRFGVKGNQIRLLEHALNVKADIVLFGHTHLPFEYEEKNVLLLNPGSASFPKHENQATAMILTLSEGEILREWILLD